MKKVFALLLGVTTGAVALHVLLLLGLGNSVYRIADRVDTKAWEGTPFIDKYYRESQQVVFASYVLGRTDRPKILFLGASATRDAFRPEQIEAVVPGAEVHNLSVGGSNVSQLDRVLTHVLKSMSLEQRSNSVLVVGLMFALMISDEAAPAVGGTYVKIIETEAGSLFQPESLVFAALPMAVINFIKANMAPYLWLKNTLSDCSAKFRDKVHAVVGLDTAVQPSAARSREAEGAQETALRMWEKYMAVPAEQGVTEAQFAKLLAMVKRARAAGMEVVILDMPLPKWLIANSPYDRVYRRRLAGLVASLQSMDGVGFFDMHSSIRDDQFLDSAHLLGAGAKHVAVAFGEEWTKRHRQGSL